MQSSNTPTATSLNQSLSVQERSNMIENIKKFLFEYLPAEQVSSPQRAQELAVRFESHVAHSTVTKEQYHVMITEKLQLIKSKSEHIAGGSSVSKAQQNDFSTTAHSASSTIPLSPAEIAQITTRLAQLRSQIPQVDRLIAHHTSNPKLAPGDLVAKLIECRNVLVSQIDLASQKNSFFLSSSQLNALVEQIQRLSANLIPRNANAASSNAAHPAASNNMTVNGIVNIANMASHASSNPSTKSTSPKTDHRASASTSSTTSSLLEAPNSNASSASNNVKSSVSSSARSTNLAPSAVYENQLLERLGLPDDELEQPASSEGYLTRFVIENSASASSLKYLRQRNLLLKMELESLRSEGFRILAKEEDFGNVSLIVQDPQCSGRRLLFQLTSIYPYDKGLLYRIQNDRSSGSDALLEKTFEPTTIPLTVSCILKHHRLQLKSDM